jgi:hypothetical protein
VLLQGCSGSSLLSCGTESDITGHWTITLTPSGQSDSIARMDTIEADLTQKPRPSGALGAFVWGTLVSTDKGFFDSLVIPMLLHNNGNKTGGFVGCTIKINVPVTTMVTDDDNEQPPLRLTLSGSVTEKGKMTGDGGSVIRVDNPAMLPETFAWSAVQR